MNTLIKFFILSVKNMIRDSSTYQSLVQAQTPLPQEISSSCSMIWHYCLALEVTSPLDTPAPPLSQEVNNFPRNPWDPSSSSTVKPFQ